AADKLREATLVPFRPIKFMLASPEETATAVWKRVQSGQQPEAGPHPVGLEDKYDGIRCQLHKVGKRVALYSRDLKEITATFQDLTDAVRGMDRDFILDGEIVAMRRDE